MKINLNALAIKFGYKQIGDANHEVSGVATLEKASENQISFFANTKYTSQLKATRAGIVILSANNCNGFNGNKIIAPDPYVAFAKISSMFQYKNNVFKGVHKTCVISDTAIIGKDVSIGPYCIVGENSVIADGTILESRVTVGDECKIAEGCLIKANIVISNGCKVGARVIIHPGAIIGADGFGLARDTDGWIKVPQLGNVIIGDDCEIGANTTIDRGTLEDTILENDVRLDNQIQIAHNVQIGEHTVMAGCSAVAGSAKIGKNCLIGGGVGIIGHLEVCDNVTLQSMALVTKSIIKPGSYSSVSPLQETRQWRRSAVRIKQLDDIARRLRTLENN